MARRHRITKQAPAKNAARGHRGYAHRPSILAQPVRELPDPEPACPTVGRDWIRNILRQMKVAGEIRSFGHGAGARWEQTGPNKGSDTLK